MDGSPYGWSNGLTIDIETGISDIEHSGGEKDPSGKFRGERLP
jgi:hypothetical protein